MSFLFSFFPAFRPHQTRVLEHSKSGWAKVKSSRQALGVNGVQNMRSTRLEAWAGKPTKIFPRPVSRTPAHRALLRDSQLRIGHFGWHPLKGSGA